MKTLGCWVASLLAVAFFAFTAGCAPSGLAVGGKVAGLAGTLRLTLNGSETFTITSNGVYKFTTALSADTIYAVTIASQPLGQTCAITNASGTIATAAVSNVNVTCVTPTIKSQFTRLDGTKILHNPGIGLSDFHHKVDPYPYDYSKRQTSQVAYYRFYWKDLETSNGSYNFNAINEAFRITRERKQVLGIRIMSAADSASPQIPAWIVTQEQQSAGSVSAVDGFYLPNYNNPVILTAAAALIARLGQDYGNNPDLYFVDIGMVGFWGEWHDLEGGATGKMPTLENGKKYVDMHRSAFPNKPLVLPIAADKQLLGYAATVLQQADGSVLKGATWRADCWGDYRFLDTEHDNWVGVYPTILNNASTNPISQNWKTSPVLLETCNGSIANIFDTTITTKSPVATFRHGKEIMQKSFDFAVERHASSINTYWTDAVPKWDQLNMPAETVQEFKATWAQYEIMLAKLGYRFALLETEVPQTIVIGRSAALKSTWQNVGNAPVYAPFKVAYRLRNVATQAVTVAWTSDASDLKTWLPKETATGVDPSYSDTLTISAAALSAEIVAGDYRLEIAIRTEPYGPSLTESGNPIALAITKVQLADGWYDVGGPIHVVASE